MSCPSTKTLPHPHVSSHLALLALLSISLSQYLDLSSKPRSLFSRHHTPRLSRSSRDAQNPQLIYSPKNPKHHDRPEPDSDPGGPRPRGPAEPLCLVHRTGRRRPRRPVVIAHRQAAERRVGRVKGAAQSLPAPQGLHLQHPGIPRRTCGQELRRKVSRQARREGLGAVGQEVGPLTT